MAAGFGHKDFYRLGPALFFPEQPWTRARARRSTTQHDRDRAKRLMKEAATPARRSLGQHTGIRVMYKHSLGGQAAARGARFPVNRPPGVDWATLTSACRSRAVGGLRHGLSAHRGSRAPRRVSLLVPGWWCNEDKEAASAAETGERPEEAQALVERNPGDPLRGRGPGELGYYNTLDVRGEYRASSVTAPRRYFWNSWLIAEQGAVVICGVAYQRRKSIAHTARRARSRLAETTAV